MVDSGPLSVLVVEDEAAVNEMILAQVRNLGYTAAGSAYDGAEAVELARRLRPDVVLMDLQMLDPLTGCEDPRAGLDAAIQIQQGGLAPVVLLTAYESPELVQQASAAGVSAYLVKPVRDNDLNRAITIARARFEDATRLHRQNEYLAALHETTLGLMNRLEPTALLENILARATQLLGTPDGYIYLAEPGDTEIHHRMGSGVFADLRRAVRAGEGMTGSVWQTGQTVVVNDYDAWPSRLPDAPLAQVKAVIGVPLKSGAHVTGVIGVARSEPGRPFTRNEVELLTGFAQLASIALDNAQLYEAVQRELAERTRTEDELRAQKQLFENLVAVARVTAERPTLEATLRNALDVTTALTGAEFGALFLLDPSGAVTHFILPPTLSAYEQRRDVIAGVMEHGLAGWVARHKQAVLIADTSRDERWMPLPYDSSNAHSALSVPILSGSMLVGVLTLTHAQPDRFTTNHLHLLQAAANQMALALRNAQVFEAQRRMADRQTVLYEVLRTVSRQLDPDSVTRLAVQAIVELTGWPNVNLTLPDEERAHWIVHAASGRLASILGLALPIHHGVTGRALRTGKTQSVPDVSLDPDYVAGHPTIRSELAVPLRRGERVQGVLNLESDRLAAFDADDVLLTESLAEVIALALDNARSYQAAQRELAERKKADEKIRRLNASLERRARELTILNAAGQTIASTLDLDSVLQVILAEVKNLLEVEGVSVLLREGEDLVLAAATGASSGSLIGRRFPAAAGLAGGVLREGRSALISDARRDPRFSDPTDAATGLTMRSILAVPLTFRGGVSGVVEAVNKIGGTFDEHDLETLETIAGSAALAIENARLYHIALEERGRLEALVESSRDGIILGGMNGRILVINTPAIEFLSLPGLVSDWIGRSIFDVLKLMRRQVPAVVRASIRDMRRVAQSQGLTCEDEYEVPPRTIHWLNLPVPAGDAPLARLMVLRDVTKERGAEKLREDVTRMMVHDLRNPAGTVLTALELLASDSPSTLSPDQLQTLQIARTGARRMLDLVNGILDVSQLESGQISLDWARIQLSQLVGEALRIELPAVKAKRLTVESDVPPALPAAWADSDLAGRVLQNLVSNAVKFTPAGGVIRVTARLEKNKLLISVGDTGSGIPPDIQGRLFQKFVRGRQVGRGSGLGLAFCKLALEAHGERIWVESTSERGTTITFSLAIATGD